MCDLISFGNAEHVVDSVSKILSSREDLDYEIDGAVVKVNDFQHQQKLGFVSKRQDGQLHGSFQHQRSIPK